MKSQVSTLTDRLVELNDQVDMLSAAVRKLQMISPNHGDNFSDVGKKRKVHLAKGLDVPLQRMTSTDSSYMIDEYRLEQEEVPTGSDFKDFSWFQNESLMETEEDGMLDESLMQELLASTPRAPPSSCISSSSGVTTAAAPASPCSDAQLPVASVAATVVSPSVGDFVSILEHLSPDLKLRFIDKVAESMGAHLALNVNMGHRDLMPLPDSTKFQYSSTPSFLLPSGSEAPDIALPLASAALGAFVQHSLHTMAHSSTIPVKDQVVHV